MITYSERFRSPTRDFPDFPALSDHADHPESQDHLAGRAILDRDYPVFPVRKENQAVLVCQVWKDYQDRRVNQVRAGSV